ncbi:hypothetical protein BC831DRAFT_197840 [Entophlyctis helioformis]|nr:hypothetical protein BC831DRAFT_197840 [Entophlyctis helioformis]
MSCPTLYLNEQSDSSTSDAPHWQLDISQLDDSWPGTGESPANALSSAPNLMSLPCLQPAQPLVGVRGYGFARHPSANSEPISFAWPSRISSPISLAISSPISPGHPANQSRSSQPNIPSNFLSNFLSRYSANVHANLNDSRAQTACIICTGRRLAAACAPTAATSGTCTARTHSRTTHSQPLSDNDNDNNDDDRITAAVSVGTSSRPLLWPPPCCCMCTNGCHCRHTHSTHSQPHYP